MASKKKSSTSKESKKLAEHLVVDKECNDDWEERKKHGSEFEINVGEVISEWLKKTHPKVRIEPVTRARYTIDGELKIIDYELVGYYDKRQYNEDRTRFFDSVLIAELEPESHGQTYSVHNDKKYKFYQAPLRKAGYVRGDIPQYYIKEDRGDHLLYMYPLYMLKQNIHRQRPLRAGTFTEFKKDSERMLIRTIEKGTKETEVMSVGWDDIFEELDHVIKRAGF